MSFFICCPSIKRTFLLTVLFLQKEIELSITFWSMLNEIIWSYLNLRQRPWYVLLKEGESQTNVKITLCLVLKLAADVPKGTKRLTQRVSHGIETENASKQLKFNFLSKILQQKYGCHELCKTNWKVMQLRRNLPTHLLLITMFSLFWSFGRTLFSIEFISDVICTQDLLLVPRDQKLIDRAPRYWGLGTSPLIVFSWVE